MTRFTLSLACLLFFSFSKTSAQTIAGIVGDLALNQNTTAETVNIFTFAPPFGQFDNLAEDSLDLNRDGIHDIVFNCFTCNTYDCGGGGIYAKGLHSGVEIMMDGDNRVFQLNAGDPIDKEQQWLSAHYATFIYKVATIAGYMEFGYWFPNPEAYVGVRIAAGQDTLYGWLKATTAVSANNGNASLKILQWAFEKSANTPQYVTTGTVTDLIACSNAVQVNLGPPVPTGTAESKADSLDLNSDGVPDVALVVSVCNTDDCNVSSTSLNGLHPGFNFVQGSNGVKRLQNGEIVGPNSNWDTSSPGYHSGYFLSTGSDANGNQTFGEWQNNNSTGYVGIRLVTPASDTLYGWIYMRTLALPGHYANILIYDCAFQHDPSQKPYADVSATPEKTVYCPGDYVVFEANTVGAEQIVWHFWDGSSDAAATVAKALPDSTVAVSFEATNQNGTTTVTQILEVSPLTLTVPSITLDCAHPAATLTAQTNIPADLCWMVGTDTTCNPTPPAVTTPVTVTVIAQDQYGCIATEQVEILLDMGVPDVSIEFDEANHLLIAYSATPDVTLSWVTMNWPVVNDTVVVSQSGTYTVIATAPNGCTAMASITITITSTGEPLSENVRLQPNPASDFLQIENQLAFDLHFKIFDATGSLKLRSGTAVANSISRLEIESLPAGLYWLMGFDSGDKPLLFKKFVKQ